VSELTATPPEQKLAEAEVDRFRGQLGPFVVAAQTAIAWSSAGGKKVGRPFSRRRGEDLARK
jgi:hypothetical protein